MALFRNSDRIRNTVVAYFTKKKASLFTRPIYLFIYLFIHIVIKRVPLKFCSSGTL